MKWEIEVTNTKGVKVILSGEGIESEDFARDVLKGAGVFEDIVIKEEKINEKKPKKSKTK